MSETRAFKVWPIRVLSESYPRPPESTEAARGHRVCQKGSVSSRNTHRFELRIGTDSDSDSDSDSEPGPREGLPETARAGPAKK